MNYPMHLYPVWRRIRQNKFFSTIYVLGSALSIASAMIVVIFVYVKVADIYPERDKSHVYQFNSVSLNVGSSGWTSQGFGLKYTNAIIDAIDSISSATAYEFYSWPPDVVCPDNDSKTFEVISRYVNPGFFKVFDYEILAGQQISEEDCISALQCCIVSDKLALRLFGSSEAAVGEDVKIGFNTFQIRGVFREPSYLQRTTYAQIIFPYTIRTPYFANASGVWNLCGNLIIYARVENDSAADSLISIFNNCIARFEADRDLDENGTGEDISITVNNVGSLSELAFGMDDGFSWSKLFSKYGFIILMLLIVPAVNLGGLISGNMESRLPEMGVRKTFGASRSRLLRAVLAENLVLTSIGGAIGLIISWLLVWQWRNWMFFLDDSVMYDAPSSVTLSITSDMIFAPAVFIIAFLLCCVVNVFAAMAPAWWSLRKPIVESLSENK